MANNHVRAAGQPLGTTQTYAAPRPRAWLSDRHSFQVTTLVMSSTARPSSAAATEPMPSWPPKIHSATVRPSAPAVSFSSSDSGPSFFSSSLRRRRAAGRQHS